MTMHVDADSAREPIIVMTRMFDAPRDVVWRALTSPEHVTRWYGGQGFTNEVKEMDVRPGGLWRLVMRAPDGTTYDIDNVYLEVVRPERLVWRNSPEGKPVPLGQLAVVQTVTLEDAGTRT